jgi:hypothetical protein
MLPTIQNECSQFLRESIGHPLIKNLPVSNEGFRKVKVRRKKQSETLSDIFNDTFKDDYSQIMQRAIFAHGVRGFIPEPSNTDVEPFYIFPIDGYRYMYSETVQSTTKDYRKTLDLLMETFGDNGIGMFQEVLKYQYSHDKLYEALTGTAEIIIYDVPHYYAIRQSLIPKYSDFLIS